jgi:hypothetical protein
MPHTKGTANIKRLSAKDLPASRRLKHAKRHASPLVVVTPRSIKKSIPENASSSQIITNEHSIIKKGEIEQTTSKKVADTAENKID